MQFMVGCIFEFIHRVTVMSCCSTFEEGHQMMSEDLFRGRKFLQRQEKNVELKSSCKGSFFESFTFE